MSSQREAGQLARRRSDRRGPGRTAWLDGRFVAATDAQVSVEDRGLRLGDGFLETILVKDGALRFWQRHERRLRATARALGMAPPPRGLAEAARELLRRDGVEQGALRILVTRGIAPGIAPPRVRARPRVVLSSRALDPDLPRARREGLRLIRLPFGRGLGRPTGGWKTLDYLPSVLGRAAAARAGADDALFTECDGQISEATSSNVFVVIRSNLVTPHLASGCLPGITRAVVLDLARTLGMHRCERSLRATEPVRASEVFLTSTLSGVVPVIAIDGTRVGNGRPGPVTRRIQAAYETVLSRRRR